MSVPNIVNCLYYKAKQFDTKSKVIMGSNNKITGKDSLVIAGKDNCVTDTMSVVVGGNNNTLNASNSSIIAGGTNIINSGEHNILLGGVFNNIVSGERNTIIGGINNRIDSTGSNNNVIGFDNKVYGNGSIAIGSNSDVTHDGVIMFNNSGGNKTSNSNGSFEIHTNNLVYSGPTGGTGVATMSIPIKINRVQYYLDVHP